jgi:hypothetical protein
MTFARGSVLMSSSDRILSKSKLMEQTLERYHTHPPITDSFGTSKSTGESVDLILTPIREPSALLVIDTWRMFPSAGCLSNFDTANTAAEAFSNLM